MNRNEFEADLRREGYEVREGSLEPNLHRGSHSHDWDARILVLDGAITLIFGEQRCDYGPGDSCSVASGTMHEEHTGTDGVRYVAGRREAAHAAAAQ